MTSYITMCMLELYILTYCHMAVIWQFVFSNSLASWLAIIFAFQLKVFRGILLDNH